MEFVTRRSILAALVKFVRLWFDELTKKEIIGFAPDAQQLKFLLHQLVIRGYILIHKTELFTYTITAVGKTEDSRITMA
jgi:hypothetical protein